MSFRLRNLNISFSVQKYILLLECSTYFFFNVIEFFSQFIEAQWRLTRPAFGFLQTPSFGPFAVSMCCAPNCLWSLYKPVLTRLTWTSAEHFAAVMSWWVFQHKSVNNEHSWSKNDGQTGLLMFTADKCMCILGYTFAMPIPANSM